MSTAKRRSVWRLSMTKFEMKTCLSSKDKSFVIITLQYIDWNFFVELAIKFLTSFKILFLTRIEKQKLETICHAVRTVRLVRNFCVVVNASIFCQSISLSQSLQSIKTRRLIKTRKIQVRKVWNSIRLRNQYRSAFACSRNRSFYHINLQISLASIRQDFQQDFQQDSHSRDFIFSVFALLLLFSHLSLHDYRICFETFNFNHDQSRIYVLINEFLRNVDR